MHYACNWLGGIGAGGERMLPTHAGSANAGAERQASDAHLQMEIGT
jgi:hypothetical protein